MKKTAKRIVCAMLALTLMMMCLASCGTTTTTYKVGICQLLTHDALDAATQGFKDYLTEKLGDQVEFDFKDAAGDSPTCTTIVSQFVVDDVDLIMANATPALQAAMSATTEIPIVATSITDFATALDADNWNGTTGINVTGSSDLAPLDKQAEMVKELCPDAKTVGILYCSAEANSKYQADIVEAKLKDLGFDVKIYTIADTNEISTVTTTACDEVDVLYLPTDNTLAGAVETVNLIAEPKKVPIITGEENMCKGCGIATLSIDYYSIGQKAGEQAYEILVNGKDPATMEIAVADVTTKKCMSDRATALGITVPSDYVAITVE